MVRAPMGRAGDPDSNPGADENFSLKLLIYNLSDSYFERYIFIKTCLYELQQISTAIPSKFKLTLIIDMSTLLLFHITHRHLELVYQFVLSSRHSPGINLR